MFGSIGGPELIVIFVLALLIFGPRKLPELGRMVGKGLSEFRRAASDLKESLEVEVAREDASARHGGAVNGAPPAGPQASPPTGTQAASSKGPIAADSVPSTAPHDALAPETKGAPDERGPEEPR